jgi:hypothetical protein
LEVVRNASGGAAGASGWCCYFHCINFPNHTIIECLQHMNMNKINCIHHKQDLSLHLLILYEMRLLNYKYVSVHIPHCCSAMPGSPGGGRTPSNSFICSISGATFSSPSTTNGSSVLSLQLSKQVGQSPDGQSRKVVRYDSTCLRDMMTSHSVS